MLTLHFAQQRQPQWRLLHQPPGPLHRVPLTSSPRRLLLLAPPHRLVLFIPRPCNRHHHQAPATRNYLADEQRRTFPTRYPLINTRSKTKRVRVVLLPDPALGEQTTLRPLLATPPLSLVLAIAIARYLPPPGSPDGSFWHFTRNGPRRPYHLSNRQQSRNGAGRSADDDRLDVGVL